MIKRRNEGKLLEIIAVRKKGNDVIYSIEKSGNTWYVYDQKQRGKTIVIAGKKIEEIMDDKIAYRAVVMEK